MSPLTPNADGKFGRNLIFHKDCQSLGFVNVQYGMRSDVYSVAGTNTGKADACGSGSLSRDWPIQVILSFISRC